MSAPEFTVYLRRSAGIAIVCWTMCMSMRSVTLHAQVPFPPTLIQDVTWDQGMHHVRLFQGITAPGDPAHPLNIGGTADAELVSADFVHLTPGFHASPQASEARFRAHIDPSIEEPGDVVFISPDATHIEDDLLHVSKWEKLEVGIQLPLEYRNAISYFFDKFYSDGVDEPATPEEVIPEYDLNPYADDSLQVYVTLTSPSGEQRMKWGFFMREAIWAAENDPNAKMVEYTESPLAPYSFRVRFAPDEEGLWLFNISVSAPYTSTMEDVPLASLDYTGYSFFCDPPKEDNRGPLKVNSANGRILEFANGDPFIGLGVNMADTRRQGYSYFDGTQWTHWTDFYQQDFDKMIATVEDLSDVGGNFMRLYLMRHTFAPEWVNLGVYDAFRVPEICDTSFPTTCDNLGMTTDILGNCQYQCWAFDQMLDQARANNVYFQLCIDPYPPIIAYEKFIWGAHPYAIHFLEPNRQTTGNPFDMKKFFLTDSADPNAPEVFYYWKRKYKYIMSRWGYSVNLPIIEPFNEIDQMLSFRSGVDLSVPSGVSCEDLEYEGNWNICMENRIEWERDPLLPQAFNDWLTNIAQFVRGEVDINDPVASSLGETEKLFLVSYTESEPADTEVPGHHLPFTNDEVDLIDVHKGFWPDIDEPNEQNPDWRMSEGYNHAQSFMEAFSPSSLLPNERKPFNHGEYNHYTFGTDVGWNNEIEKILHNYDVSFHNEIWAGAFSGKFATGTTWHWERVFWWQDALKPPPYDVFYDDSNLFSNVLGAPNPLLVNGDVIPVVNKTIQHNLAKLNDLLNNYDYAVPDLLNSDFTTHHSFDPNVDGNQLEAFYMKSPWNSMAVGWVRNRNASTMKNFYLYSGFNHFLDCQPPNALSQEITLADFEADSEYTVTWFPTRINQISLPETTTVTADEEGMITLNLAGEFGGIENNYLDTMRSDYAFVLSMSPLGKRFNRSDSSATYVDPDWDFDLYPNPARDMIFLRLPNDLPKTIRLLDVSGRQVEAWVGAMGSLFPMGIDQLSKGIYYVWVSDGKRQRTKKFVVH